MRSIYISYGSLILALTIASVSFSPEDIVMAVNGLNTPGLDVFFSFITGFGNGLILLPFVLLLLFRRVFLSFALALSAVLQGLVVVILKKVVFPMAPRPINSLDASLVHFVPGIDVHKIMTFPSGHSVTIFGLCMFLSLCYRSWGLRVFLLILAIAVGISRVYLLQHFLADVAFGAMLGSLTGAMAFHYFERMNRPRWMENRLDIRFRMPQERPNSVGY